MSDEPITIEEVRAKVCWHCGQPLINPAEDDDAGLARLVRRAGEDDLAGFVVHRACQEG